MGDNVGVHPGYCVVLTMELTLPLTLNQSYHIAEIKGFSRLALAQEAREYEEMLGIVAANVLREDFPQSMGLAGGGIFAGVGAALVEEWQGYRFRASLWSVAKVLLVRAMPERHRGGMSPMYLCARPVER